VRPDTSRVSGTEFASLRAPAHSRGTRPPDAEAMPGIALCERIDETVARRGLYALGLVFAAVGFGLTFAHFLEIPGKRQLTGAEWLKVQHTFYGGYAVFGGIAEVGGLLVSLGILAIDHHSRGRTLWPLISAIAFAGMLGDFLLGNQPINEQVATWTPETIPSDWMALRDRWDMSHTLSAVFAAVAFLSLLVGWTETAPGERA
jgi:hypothetical protein